MFNRCPALCYHFIILQMNSLIFLRVKRVLCHFLALQASPGKKNEIRKIGQGCTGGGEVREGWFDNRGENRYVSCEMISLVNFVSNNNF